ncbi:MAG TPA: response regulator [Myxococcaceae bacterium]
MSAGRTVSSRSSPEAMVAVVEDDAAARRALSRMLRAQGFRVASFSSAEELLQALADLRPGCLVIDVMLPGMSGPDLLERLRADQVRLPAIFVTGRIDAPQMLRRRGLGDVPCLQKPFEPALLVQAVSRAVDAVSSQRT